MIRKSLLYIFLAISVYLAYVCITLALMPPVAELADKKFTTTIQVKDWQGASGSVMIGSNGDRIGGHSLESVKAGKAAPYTLQ